jgi:hypothetical protein
MTRTATHFAAALAAVAITIVMLTQAVAIPAAAPFGMILA